MLIGAHVSAAGGIDKAPARAAEWGCEVLQTFSRPPQGGEAPKLTDEIVSNFKAEMKRCKQKEHYIHTPYFINFASGKTRVSKGSIGIVRQELDRGSLLGSTYVMFHTGSAKDVGFKKGMQMAIDGIAAVLKGYRGSTELLVEISAGAGETLGDTFEELAQMIEGVEKKTRRKNVLGVCLDTQHAFASGYDLRTAKSIKEVLKQFDNSVGLEYLKLAHCNDSKVDFGSHVDRHENIGKGKLGKEAFKAILHEPKLKKMNLVLETPHDGKGAEIKKDLQLLKKLREL